MNRHIEVSLGENHSTQKSLLVLMCKMLHVEGTQEGAWYIQKAVYSNYCFLHKTAYLNNFTFYNLLVFSLALLLINWK